jgi:hypothetical protein
MATQTPNIGLWKQAGTEYGDWELTNNNLDVIDDEIAQRGKTFNGTPVDENGDFKVNEIMYARQIVTDDTQQSSGEFLFRTTGGEAGLSDGPAKLVSIFVRAVHTGIVPESLTLTVNAVPREEGEDTITATIDRDTFVAYVSTSGTTTLTYTDAWSANPSLYGVTVEGTPVSGDQIVIVYVKENRGTITVSDPDEFISTGWNLYNHTVGYARVKKYSTQYGFLVGGAYTALQFSETLDGTKTTITPASGYFTIPSDGYVWVTGGNDTTTYILMTWSDWGEGYEGDWQAYTESVIDLTSIMTNFPYGLMQVAGYADEIDFGMARAISRIERLAYTAENLAAAEASGRPYDADMNYIYLVRDTEAVYSFSSSITGDYTASDHGEEIINGGTVPVFVSTLYGQNLVDKLRTDVLTISQQSLSTAQKAQVLQNIGAVSTEEISTKELTAGSLSSIESQLITLVGTLSANEIVKVKFTLTSASDPFEALSYIGTVSKLSNAYFAVNVQGAYATVFIQGAYRNGTWAWNDINSKIPHKYTETATTGDSGYISLSVTGHSVTPDIFISVVPINNTGGYLLEPWTQNGAVYANLKNRTGTIQANTQISYSVCIME